LFVIRGFRRNCQEGLPWSRGEGRDRRRAGSASRRSWFSPPATGYQGISAGAPLGGRVPPVPFSPIAERVPLVDHHPTAIRPQPTPAGRHQATSRPKIAVRRTPLVAKTYSARTHCASQTGTAPSRPLPDHERVTDPASKTHQIPQIRIQAFLLFGHPQDRKTVPSGGGAGLDWSCTWQGVLRTTHSSAICRPPHWSATTAPSTGCACRGSTPRRSSPVYSAPMSMVSWRIGPAQPQDSEPATATRPPLPR